MPALLSPTVSGFAWHALFGSLPERQMGLLDPAERQQRLETVVLAASDLQQRFTTALQSYPSQSHPEVRLWLGYLSKILHEEVVCLVEADCAGQRVRQRTPKEQRADPATAFRLISATDPEATYRVHGPAPEDSTFGYNVQVAAAQDCFIRETQAYTGATPDQTGIAPLLAEQLAHQGVCPPKFIYDQAAGAGKTRADVEQASAGQTQLVAKTPPSNTQSDRFGPYDFRLSADRLALTCPGASVSTCAYRSGTADGRDFSFYAGQCWQGTPPARWKEAGLTKRCPLWEQCRDHRQGPASLRKVFISDYRQYILGAQVYNQTEPFQVEMRQRPLIERVIFELTHYCGARHCRRRGLGNADWQAKMCATVYNLKLWLRKLIPPARRVAQIG